MQYSLVGKQTAIQPQHTSGVKPKLAKRTGIDVAAVEQREAAFGDAVVVNPANAVFL